MLEVAVLFPGPKISSVVGLASISMLISIVIEHLQIATLPFRSNCPDTREVHTNNHVLQAALSMQINENPATVTPGAIELYALSTQVTKSLPFSTLKLQRCLTLFNTAFIWCKRV